MLRFAAQEIFLIIINVENICAAFNFFFSPGFFDAFMNTFTFTLDQLMHLC